jgi:mannose-6-phosphate isomerase-like protein (cupin superfamily)
VKPYQVFLLAAIVTSAASAQTSTPTAQAPAAHEGMTMPAYIKFEDLKWSKLLPGRPDSAEISILHVDPKTGATQLLIRSPANYHAEKHWHTANETHLVLSGTFIMQDENGQRAVLGPGSFNYMPSGMVHEAWSPPNEGNVVFITVDGPWDLNLVEGPNAKQPPPQK